MSAPTAMLSAPIASSSNSWLITPNVGLTIWTLVVFLISMYILNKVAFPRILTVVVLQGALDIHRVSVVAFDEIGIVAIHRAHKVGKRSQ